jgi:hypothetical protein
MGYDWNSGMSMRAVEAYDRGLVPASKIGNGIPAKLVEQFCEPEEWHHTSSFYNATNFYNKEYVLATFGIIRSEDYDPDPEAIKALKEYKELLHKKTAPEVYENCEVKWIEWKGSRRHPIPQEHKAFGCRVEKISLYFVRVIFEDGTSMVKKIGSNGFRVWSEPLKRFIF